MGDQDGFHFVRLVSAFGQTVYRVQAAELTITNTFSLTTNSENWPMLFLMDKRNQWIISNQKHCMTKISFPSHGENIRALNADVPE
jgi:hypothetical protein